VGGYKDWAKRGKALLENDAPQGKANAANKDEENASADEAKPKKLSYKLQRELDTLPARIEELEKYLQQLAIEVEKPDFYDQSFDVTKDALSQLTETQQELDKAMNRWAELEAML